MKVREIESKEANRGKNVKSTDPRKPGVMAAFKKLVPECRKVTCVKEWNGKFHANCIGGKTASGCFIHLGTFELDMEEQPAQQDLLARPATPEEKSVMQAMDKILAKE